MKIIEIPREFMPTEGSSAYVGRKRLLSANPWTSHIKMGGPQDQRWILDLTLPTLKGEQIDRFEAVFDQGDGASGFYTAFDAAKKWPRGTGTGLARGNTSRFSDGTAFSDGTEFLDGISTCIVSAVNVRGSKQVTLTGLVASQPIAFARGDMLAITQNGERYGFLHRAMANVGTDSTGSATISITPPLRQNVRVGQVVRVREPRGVFQVQEPDQLIVSRQYGVLAQPAFRLVEAPEALLC